MNRLEKVNHSDLKVKDINLKKKNSLFPEISKQAFVEFYRCHFYVKKSIISY